MKRDDEDLDMYRFDPEGLARPKRLRDHFLDAMISLFAVALIMSVMMGLAAFANYVYETRASGEEVVEQQDATD